MARKWRDVRIPIRECHPDINTVVSTEGGSLDVYVKKITEEMKNAVVATIYRMNLMYCFVRVDFIDVSFEDSKD